MTTLKKIALAATAALALPALALASPGKGADGKKMDRAEHKAKMLEKYDANDDGKLDDAERQIMRQERIQERFERIDANNDGKISFDEFEAAADKKHERRKGMRGKHGKRGMHHK
jgi:Ca2+-binding EF-hand superfamily protein